MFKQAFEVRDKIKDTAVLATWLKGLCEISKQLTGTEIASYTLSDYTRYYRDGDRTEFEDKYFDRRARLASYALMIFIYRDMGYLPLLEDVIWAICEETTWVLPAHMPTDSYDYRHFIDLFAAETGSALAEIKYLLNDTLSERVKNRIHKEVQERIIDTYLDENTAFGWYYCEINWASVCSSGCAASCIYEGTSEEAEAAINKTENIMKNFLRGFSAEGICMEGYLYWNYGFGFFMFYADLVKTYTNGKINHFADERVRSIARFVNTGLIRQGTPIAFADCADGEAACIGFEYYLSSIYDEITLSNGGWAGYDSGGRYRWAPLLRSAVWTAMFADKIRPESDKKEEIGIYPDAGWYIKKTQSYIICAKGGHNEEAHNHNDVGSFYIDNYEKQIFADLGSGEYTREYFDWEGGRYKCLVCGSQGHNVPVINGQYQKSGVERRAKINAADDNTFSTELSEAYDIDALKSYVRTISMTDREITVVDCFEGELSEIRERFIAREKPERRENTLYIGNTVIECDIVPEITEEKYAGRRGVERSAWIIDYVIAGNRKKVEFSLKIQFPGR